MRARVTCTVNGDVQSHLVEPRKTLADLLREDCGLTGTHLGCEQGACGSCTVLLEGEPVRSCTMFAIQCEGANITTIEGIGTQGDLHPLQSAFIAHHALQCGYCTPGFIMLAVHVMEQNPGIGRSSLEEVLSSNLCRCTGYRNIFDAVAEALESARTAGCRADKTRE